MPGLLFTLSSSNSHYGPLSLRLWFCSLGQRDKTPILWE
jgi:hypothetical protein